jgi:hypothetical protein
MGIEHLVDILNKPTDRGYLAYAHTSRVSNTYYHWPKEAYEAAQANLPALRVLSYVQNIIGAELEHIHNLQTPNHIANSLRAAFKELDEIRTKKRENIPKKEYNKQFRDQCQPLNFSDRLLRHLAPPMGGGSLRLDPNPRQTHNTHRTHISSHTKHKSDTCQTQKWRSKAHQQQPRARSIDAQNHPKPSKNPRT